MTPPCSGEAEKENLLEDERNNRHFVRAILDLFIYKDDELGRVLQLLKFSQRLLAT